MWSRSLGLALAVAALGVGCMLDRSGTGLADGSAPGLDAGSRDGEVGRADGGVDAGGCPPGAVDLDSHPANGCECVIETERCGGGDEDCDGSVDEGCGCSPEGSTQPCGATDEGECALGTQTCEPGGAWGGCEGAVLPVGEECNRRDDDCDGTVDDYERSCGGSGGACAPGTQRCRDGEWGLCSGVAPADEACDAARLDEDCDGEANEGCECDGVETRTCTDRTCTGTQACDGAGRWGPCTSLAGSSESCDGTDQDCNGIIDDGSADCEDATDCELVRLPTGVYLFCFGEQTASWSDARDDCARVGYHLATIDDGAEDAALLAAAGARGSGDWWIGVNDLDGDDRFEWEGPPSSFDHFRMNEPDSGECGVLDAMRLDWESMGCGGAKAFICEAP